MEQPGTSPGAASGEPTLQRTIGLWQMTLYGAGSMLGAGIYGLLGQVAAEMGSAVWLAFALSMVAAGLTGLSYASLGSRYPRAGGAAFITHRAYRRTLLTHVVGLSVACSGFTSIAAGARVVGENLQALPALQGLPTGMLAFIYLVFVGALVYRGIRESMWANVVFTLVEAAGLLFVIAVCLRFWGSTNLLEFPSLPETEAGLPLVFLVQGVVLTFYSFLGFEDAINVAEELKNPQRNLPLGLVSALVLTVLIYMGVSISAASVVPWQELAEAKAPLVEVVGARGTLVPGLDVHCDYHLRGGEYRADQLCDRITPPVWYGAGRPAAASSRKGSSGAPHTPCGCGAHLRADRAPDPVGGHFAAGFGYGAPPPPGVLGRKQCACHPEAQT